MKRIILFITLISTAFICNAQFHYEIPQNQRKEQKVVTQTKSGSSFDIRKLTIGGGLGLQFGDYTLINIAPQVGYSFSKYLNAGVGFTYTYWKDDYYSGNIKFKDKSSYFGFNLYGKFYPIENIVLMVQPEINRVWQTVENTSSKEKLKEEKFVPVCLLGGGLRLGPVTAMIQYDVVQNDRTPYGDNIFYSLGYTFNF